MDKLGTTTQNILHSFIMASTLCTHLGEVPVFCLLLLILVLLLLFFFPNLVFIIIIIIIIIIITIIIIIITIVAKFVLLFQSKCQSETMIKM